MANNHSDIIIITTLRKGWEIPFWSVTPSQVPHAIQIICQSLIFHNHGWVWGFQIGDDMICWQGTQSETQAYVLGSCRTVLDIICGKSQNKDALLCDWPLVASHSEKRDSIGIPVTMRVEWVFRAHPTPIRPHYLNQLLSAQLIDKGSPIWQLWKWNGSKIRLKAFLFCRPTYILSSEIWWQ